MAIELPIDFEKELKEAREKLEFHSERVNYHKAQEAYYRQRVEELMPLTGAHERHQAKVKEALENSEEFVAIRKKIKKKQAADMVQIMLRRIKEGNL